MKAFQSWASSGFVGNEYGWCPTASNDRPAPRAYSPCSQVTGEYSVPSASSGAGAVPPVITTAFGSAALIAAYADLTIAAYLSGSGFGCENSWWFGSFQSDHVVIVPRRRGLVDRDPYRAAAAPAKRP